MPASSLALRSRAIQAPPSICTRPGRIYTRATASFDTPEPQRWNFRAQLDIDRETYEKIAEEMRDPNLPVPADYKHTYGGKDPRLDCRLDRPVYLIPGGTALAALWDRLEQPKPGEDWEGLTMAHVFQNGFVDWPSDWPVSEERAKAIDALKVMKTLQRADPKIAADDIHMSYIGSYYIGLVAYATIYRSSPVGLPSVDKISSSLAHKLQTLAWDVVRKDKRTGLVDNRTPSTSP